MVRLFKDKVGNELFLSKKHLFAKNKEGELVTETGLTTLLRRANKARKIKFKE